MNDLGICGEAADQSTETVSIGFPNHGPQSGSGPLWSLAASSQTQPRNSIAHLLVERDQVNLQATLQHKIACEMREVRNTSEQPAGLFRALGSQGIKVVDVKRLKDMSQQISQSQRLPFRHRRFPEHSFEFRDAADPGLVVIVKFHAQPFVGTLGFGKRRIFQADGVNQRLKYWPLNRVHGERAIAFRECRRELA